ncbi:hypothetical protein [Pontibacter sp. G13]|uniref:hypothetical protein n=1 Tax=Pontibacter sp. G13 TaxID=3074898 RepID=UPI00288C0F64|nr:hypothetical protein [Pontibacter sp. G13]WNJ20731.1 hypothetical protein RJD25_09635 [Pontibacter sp. G13]
MMGSIARTWALTACILGSVWAPLTAQNLSDSVATVYQNYLLLQTQNKALHDSLTELTEGFTQLAGQVIYLETESRTLQDSLQYFTSEYQEVENQLSSLNADLSSNLDQVQKLTKADILSKEGRLKNRRHKIVSTAKFVKNATNSFDAIDAALATTDYLNVVTQLNSPTNDDLGFSLDQEIMRMLDDMIIKGNPKFNDKQPDKFRSMIQNIVANPFSAAVSGFVPALNSIRSVLELVTSVSIRERSVSVKEYQAFKDSLGMYTQHYQHLARATYEFQGVMDKLRVKHEALRTVINTYTLERIQTLVPGVVPDNDAYQLDELRYSYYEYDQVGYRVDEVIYEYRDTRGRINYQDALNDARLAYPLYALTQAQFIEQELANITNQYVSAYELYHQQLRQVLMASKKLSREPAKVDTKITELDEKLSRVISTFRKNVKAREVHMAMQEIPTY